MSPSVEPPTIPEARSVVRRIPDVRDLRAGAKPCDCKDCPDCAPVEVRSLAVVSCLFNPARFRRPVSNFHRFAGAAQAWGVPLYAAEVAFGRDPFETDATLKIRAGDEHKLWQKERLLNLLVERLPAQFDCVAWIDADILMLSHDWPRRTLEALRTWPVIQPWTQLWQTDRTGAVSTTGRERWMRSVGAGGSHKGYAWAARRSLFPLYDHHVSGSGDTAMWYAWTARDLNAMGDGRLKEPMNPAWMRSLKEYADRTYPVVKGRIGHIPGDIVHLYHGKSVNRLYWERWAYLSGAGFDPAADIEVDPANGLYRWCSNKPEMHRRMREYSALRREDD